MENLKDLIKTMTEQAPNSPASRQAKSPSYRPLRHGLFSGATAVSPSFGTHACDPEPATALGEQDGFESEWSQKS